MVLFFTARKRIEYMIPIMKSDRDIHSLTSVKSMPSMSLYGMFIHSANLHILRAVEPGLRLHHHERMCDDTDVQCTQSRAFNLGSKSQLAQLILDYMGSQVS